MSSSCGTVSLDRYWSYIGTPLFFTTIAVGIFTLFQVQDIQLLDKETIGKTVQQLRDVKKVGTGTPADVANPAAPGKLARAAKTISALGKAFRKPKNPNAATPPVASAPPPPPGT